MSVIQLDPSLPVEVTAKTLPVGMADPGERRRGVCIAWWVGEEYHQWLVCFDGTGEMVWVPMNEIKMQPSWSNGRRYNLPASK